LVRFGKESPSIQANLSLRAIRRSEGEAIPSHLPELAQHLPARVVVTRSESGSTVSIV
jgi:hypothetical protein